MCDQLGPINIVYLKRIFKTIELNKDWNDKPIVSTRDRMAESLIITNSSRTDVPINCLGFGCKKLDTL